MSHQRHYGKCCDVMVYLTTTVDAATLPHESEISAISAVTELCLTLIGVIMCSVHSICWRYYVDEVFKRSTLYIHYHCMQKSA